MRVALLSGNAPAHNAIGNQIAEKVRFFQDRGAEVRVFVQDAQRLHPALRGCCSEVAHAPADGPVWDYLGQCDLIFAVYAQHFELLECLPRLAGKGPRIVFDYHGVTPVDLWNLDNRESLQTAVRQRGYVWCTDHAVTTSQANRRELFDATHFLPEHVSTLPLVVDTERMRPEPPERWLHKRLGIDGRILLFVGRLASNKRVPLLIEALARLGDASAHVVAIGDCGDVYGGEADRCRMLADRLGVQARVHLYGQIADADLPRAYRSADVLVMPSLHEGFCVPVIEAMACGLPVVASRCAALPETLGDAGLTFTPNNVDDLVDQLRRVLPAACGVAERRTCASPRHIAMVSFRFGPEIVGGAEASLRTMARALRDAGQHVEIFTTCTTSESHWRNELPAGTFNHDGLTVHRFPIDSHDAAAHDEIVRAIVEADGLVAPEVENRYLENSIHSSALIETLRQRCADFDAIITGPYLFGLTADVAAEFPAKTLVVPCFHDEALARLSNWPRLFGRVGGVLYHSVEEQHLAQQRLGVNHPNARVIDTALPKPNTAAPARLDRPYVVYCGRYSVHKNVPLLLDWLRRYQAEHSGRFDVLFMGQGDVKLPTEPWLHDLGRVEENRKHSVLAGARVLIQLSTQESLSLVALEAWQQGTPVIIHRDCRVLVGQIERSSGGRSVGDYTEFAAALDDLLRDEARWRERGVRGRAYVESKYASASQYVASLVEAIDRINVPIALQMRERGLQRAAQFARPRWQQQFAEFVEHILTKPARTMRDDLRAEPQRNACRVSAGTRTLLLPIRLANAGTHAATPGATFICHETRDAATDHVVIARAETCLPALLAPGQSQVVAVPIALPAEVGAYRLGVWMEHRGRASRCVEMPLDIEAGVANQSPASVFLEVVQQTLPATHRLQQLPADYVDVTEGRLAPVKRLIKRKLLHNFKHAYVDVLSRQQSQVNSQVVLMIQQLADCCAMLDHAVAGLHQRLDGIDAKMEQALTALSEHDARA